MPLLFLERMEEKEMPTLQEVKNQMDKVRTQLEIFIALMRKLRKQRKKLKLLNPRKRMYKHLKIFKLLMQKKSILLI